MKWLTAPEQPVDPAAATELTFALGPVTQFGIGALAVLIVGILLRRSFRSGETEDG